MAKGGGMFKKLILINTKLTEHYKTLEKAEQKKLEKKYKSWVSEQPSGISGSVITGIPHHVRVSNNAGTSKKPSDIYMFPVTFDEHDFWHRFGNEEIEKHYGFDIAERFILLHDKFCEDYVDNKNSKSL